MLRNQRLIVVLFIALLGLTVPAVFAQPGVVASFTGTISSPAQEDRITFEVDTDQIKLNPGGSVDLVFLLSRESSAGSAVDPGLLSVTPKEGGDAKVEVRKPDTADSTASIALATLTPGTYEIAMKGEHKTTGAYRLDVFLAGDANTDFKVDAEDSRLISQLNATKAGDAEYSPFADVDRNGVINGGDRQRAEANFGAEAVPPQAENPLDQTLPAGALALVGASPDTFVNRTGGLRFSLAGAEFDPALEDITLTVNGTRAGIDRLVVEPHLLTANVTLADGRNDISLKAYDLVGRPLYYNATLWAGSSTLRVNLVNANGSAFLGQATVVAALSDDPGVTAEAITSAGSVTFTNVPARTILVKAKGIGNEIGTAGVIGSQGTVTIKMTGFNAPSPIDNNDFSLGTDGWVIGPGAVVSIIPHTEVIPGFFNSVSKTAAGFAADSIVDQDFMLGTSGEGERSVSRTFTTSEGTTAVKIRYRFITSEVPGGYFGSQYNDYFRVSLRSQNGGGSESETNSMNGLGLGAFNFATGETNWREVTLDVDREGDTIQADIAVANVGDGLFQSQVVIDFVEEIKDQVRPQLSWNNQQGGLDLRWEVLDRALEDDVTINVYFANGTAYSNILGDSVFSHVVPAGTQPGPGGPVHIPGAGLADDPNGTTHLLAASSETMVASLADVRINYGPNANAGVVSAGMTNIVKDGLRAAGASVGTISSTLRTPADQARAMFNNALRNGAASQLALYGAAGDAVINVYIRETAGMTPAQIRQNAATIQAAMETEINNQGPENVSRHCGDPAVRTVVDVAYSSFNATNRPLFRTSVEPRVSRFIDEPNNSCYHLELVN